MAVEIAALGVPDAIKPITDCGFMVMTYETDYEKVMKTPQNDSSGKVFIVRATSDPRVSAWLNVQKNKGAQIVIVKGEKDPEMTINGIPVVPIPNSVRNIIGVLGAPERPGDDAIIGVDVEPEKKEEQQAWIPAPTTPTAEQPAPQPVAETPPVMPWEEQPETPAPPSPVAPPPMAPAPQMPWEQQPATPAPAPQMPWEEQSTPDPFAAEPFAAPETIRRAKLAGEKAPIIVCWAGKGGSGKSSVALSIAATAAAAGLKTVLVDMNRGQGDIRPYLRLSRNQDLPTIYDASLAGVPKAAIVSPTQITQARHSTLPEIKFGAIFAPRRGQADPELVTADMYRAAIDAARAMADIVIVDTQIMEDSDTSGLIDGVAIPLVQGNSGWAIGVADASLPGVENTVAVMSKFGVTADSMMFVVNKMVADTSLKVDALDVMMHGKAVVLGTIPLDETVVTLTESGRLPNEFEPMADVARAVLLRVTGRNDFTPRVSEAPAKKGFLAGLFGGRKK